jgi:Xaa-Pro dipeptidase
VINGNSSNQGPLDDLFPAHVRTLVARAEAALAATGFDGLVVPAGRPVSLPFDDQDYPFRASPYYRWWVPRADPGACVVFEPGRKPLLVLPRVDDFWHLPPEAPSGSWSREFELRPVRSAQELSGQLRAGPRWAVLGDATTIPEPELANCNPPALISYLDFERAIKTPYEIECHRSANVLAARAHAAALQAFRSGASEFDIHLAYCAALRHREEELPYNNIVALASHGAVLHYQRLDRTPDPVAESLLIDAGASERGYAADISRTHVTGSGEMAPLVEAMDRLQLDLCAMVRPGQDYVGIHLQAHRSIGALLHDAGLIRIDAEAAVATGLTSVFFPHGIGHLLGLQVHDAGGLLGDRCGTLRLRPPGHPYLRLTRRLEPGFVVTIEPGIYFIESLLARAAAGSLGSSIVWNRVDALRRYGGIRIEDNVVASPAGPENLTRQAFIDLRIGR